MINMYLLVETSSVSKDKVTQQLYWHSLASVVMQLNIDMYLLQEFL